MHARIHIARNQQAAARGTVAPFDSVRGQCARERPGGLTGGEGFGSATIRRRSASGSGPASVPAAVHEALHSPGRPLDASTRAFFEPRFGHAFGNVRVHADAEAGESARAVNALAYAVGSDVVFGPGMYAPHTAAGRELLAHELAHTLQQDSASGGTNQPFVLGDPGDAAEGEADAAVRAVLDSGSVSTAFTPGNPQVVRRDQGPPAKKDAPIQQAPGDTGKKAQPGAGSGGSSANSACQPQGMDRAAFLGVKGTSTDLFGLTPLDTSNVTFPTVNTFPAKPSGVTVGSTSAALPTINSVFTKNGTFVEGKTKVGPGEDAYACDSGEYPMRWILSTSKIGEGEQEHCNDFQYAFDISLKKYAAAVNDLAAKRTVFPSHNAVKATLKKVTGVAPDDWQSVFNCLVKKTEFRDPAKPGDASWHTPHPFMEAPKFPKCKEARATITDGSLSEVGRHASGEIIEGCGEKPAAAGKAAGVKSSAASAPAAGKVVRRKATFVSSTPREERNAAELIVTGGPAGVTLPMLNGKKIRNAADSESAVKEPEIESTPKKGGGVQCRIKTVPDNTGSYDEAVLTAGPWVFQTPKANVPGNLGFTACSGAGNASVTAHGKPSDADVAKANRTHEDHHATDDEQAFNDTIGKWDEKMTQAVNDKTVFDGDSAALCERAIFAAIDGSAKSVAGRYWGSVDAAGNAFHRTAGGGTLGISSASADPACAHVDIDVHT